MMFMMKYIPKWTRKASSISFNFSEEPMVPTIIMEPQYWFFDMALDEQITLL